MYTIRVLVRGRRGKGEVGLTRVLPSLFTAGDSLQSLPLQLNKDELAAAIKRLASGG